MAPDDPIRLAISTCPNDSFAFHALIERQVDWRGLEFDVRLMDISELNSGMFASEFDVAKASFHAAALLSDHTFVLPCGAALGFGVGPLLLSADVEPTIRPESGNLTLCPGEFTTATMLLRMFYGTEPRIRQVVFSEIMPALKSRQADFGVCIHEGRFTWQDHGLGLVEDLGERWERETELPLPLGGILAQDQLNPATIEAVTSVIRESIQWGHQNREATLPTMRKYAQSFDDEVLFQHVDLYVNDWTTDLGEIGRNALRAISDKIPGANAIRVWQQRG